MYHVFKKTKTVEMLYNSCAVCVVGLQCRVARVVLAVALSREREREIEREMLVVCVLLLNEIM